MQYGLILVEVCIYNARLNFRPKYPNLDQENATWSPIHAASVIVGLLVVSLEFG